MYSVEAMVTVADSRYGPEARTVRVGAVERRIYLPLMMKE